VTGSHASHMTSTHIFIGCFHPCNEPCVHGCQPRHRDQREATDTKLYDSKVGQGEHTLSATGTLASAALCILVGSLQEPITRALGCTTQIVVLNTHRLCAWTTRRRPPLHCPTPRLLLLAVWNTY